MAKEVKKVTKEKVEEKVEKKKSGTYHVSKREDGKWQVKVSGGKVLKLFKTKAEAEEYAKQTAANQDKAIIFHASKGKNKGKFGKL